MSTEVRKGWAGWLIESPISTDYVASLSRCPLLIISDLSALQYKVHSLSPVAVTCCVRERGIHKGAAAPLVGGAGSIAACQRFLLALGVLPAWGEPARPGLPPEGETGKGAIKFLAPQAIRFTPPALPLKHRATVSQPHRTAPTYAGQSGSTPCHRGVRESLRCSLPAYSGI